MRLPRSGILEVHWLHVRGALPTRVDEVPSGAEDEDEEELPVVVVPLSAVVMAFHAWAMKALQPSAFR